MATSKLLQIAHKIAHCHLPLACCPLLIAYLLIRPGRRLSVDHRPRILRGSRVRHTYLELRLCFRLSYVARVTGRLC